MKKNIKVDIVIPVYNEELILENSVKKLREFLKDNFHYKWNIVIADNASTDKTLEIAVRLSKKYRGVSYTHLDQKGRGKALKKTWMRSKADIISYMDVDLSTNLGAFPKMIKAIINGYDAAIGSRLIGGAEVTRCIKREILSRGYVFMLKLLLLTTLSDTQCGFKALTKEAAIKLIPKIKDNKWFFDTELLVLAEKNGYKIKQIPIKWVEDPDSKVNIITTVYEYIKNAFRLRIDLLKL